MKQNIKDISIETVCENLDEDTYLYTSTATRNGLVWVATGYTSKRAMERAIAGLEELEKDLNGRTPNAENTPEIKLSEISQAEKDYLNMFQIQPDIMLAM